MGLSKFKAIITLSLVLLIAATVFGWFFWQKKHAGAALPTEKKTVAPVAATGHAAAGDHAASKNAPTDMLGHVSLSPDQRLMANVATVAARKDTLHKEINAVGIVQFDQSRQAKVTAWTAGRIDRLYVDTVGASVSKDRPVAEMYSPDLLSTQQEYLLAVKSREQLRSSPVPSIAQGGEGLVQSARQRLMLFGVKEEQIDLLEKKGMPDIRLPIFTPLGGVVIEKMVQKGQYVNSGDVLFNIADLSQVWIELEIYENEFPSLSLGQQVEIRSQSFPDRVFGGRIGFIYPFLDPKTRTVKARVPMANPGMRLKPDMFVNAVIKTPLGKGIVVPATAVMDSGKRQVVWVETAAGMFEPRDVKVGQRSDDRFLILSGLKEGERVAVSGGYLIDSESQLKGGGGQDHSQHGGGGPAPKAPIPAPASVGQRQGETAGAGHQGHNTAPEISRQPQAPAKNESPPDPHAAHGAAK